MTGGKATVTRRNKRQEHAIGLLRQGFGQMGLPLTEWSDDELLPMIPTMYSVAEIGVKWQRTVKTLVTAVVELDDSFLRKVAKLDG